MATQMDSAAVRLINLASKHVGVNVSIREDAQNPDDPLAAVPVYSVMVGTYPYNNAGIAYYTQPASGNTVVSHVRDAQSVSRHSTGRGGRSTPEHGDIEDVMDHRHRKSHRMLRIPEDVRVKVNTVTTHERGALYSVRPDPTAVIICVIDNSSMPKTVRAHAESAQLMRRHRIAILPTSQSVRDKIEEASKGASDFMEQ